MEGSKQFAKEVMLAANVPTAKARVVTSAAEARDAVAAFGIPVVLKADGLAAGKGVMVCATAAEAEDAIRTLLVDCAFGEAGREVLVEEFLEGEEVSMLAFVDGATVVPMVSAQDHKRLKNGDEGPNTGGMGAYSPAPAMTPDMQDVVMNRVFRPVVTELATRGIDYKGVLYAGLMLTRNGPKVLEFNCRFGDPETQCILPRMASPLVPVLQACIDGTLTPELVQWQTAACVCVVMVAGGYPGTYEKGAKITGIEEAAQTADVAVFHAGTALRGESVVTNGGRVLGVTATGENIAAAVRTAYHAVIRVKFDRAHYRTDIAHRALERTK
jgi:phosphoribosylamine--glycine ligase